MVQTASRSEVRVALSICGFVNDSVMGSSDQPVRRVSGVRSATGTDWKAKRAIASIGMVKNRARARRNPHFRTDLMTSSIAASVAGAR